MMRFLNAGRRAAGVLAVLLSVATPSLHAEPLLVHVHGLFFSPDGKSLFVPSHTGLAVFRGEFDRSTPRRPTRESESRWPLTVAVIFVLSGAALSLLDQGARTFVLSLARPRSQPRS